jgi:hypothetical protein
MIELAGRASDSVSTSADFSRHADMQELSLSPTTSISFPNGKDDLLTFTITLKPDDGFWKGGTYPFLFKIPSQYPHQPPKVLCETKVCVLRILRNPAWVEDELSRYIIQTSTSKATCALISSATTGSPYLTSTTWFMVSGTTNPSTVNTNQNRLTLRCGPFV